MRFDKDDKHTWPQDGQDVQVWAHSTGFTHASFLIDEFDGPGFGNWYERTSDAEDADLVWVTGEIQWWPLPNHTEVPEAGELKDCPFCGGLADPKECAFTRHGSDVVEHEPGCSDCGATARSTEDWNRRVKAGNPING